MKKILCAVAGLCGIVSSFAQAAPLLSSVRSAGNPNAFSVYVNGDNLNGTFDTIIFNALPSVGSLFSTVNTGSPASPRLPGDPSTFINRMLDQDPAEVPGALGFTRVGVTNTANQIGFTAGPLGGKITTPAAPGLFLANFLLPNPAAFPASATVQLVNAGAIIFEATIPFPFPEPTSAGLAGLGLLGLAVARRRLVRQA